MAVEINWDNFSLYNNGPDGLRTKFENLCRQLFANEFLKSNKLMTHLHSDPNQPGIESEPIFDEDTNRYIGYQTSVYKGYKQDKIEMRGDRAEMSDFPLYLNTVAGGLDRRDQTIGGFSFVVKIYAVPVVEIIG